MRVQQNCQHKYDPIVKCENPRRLDRYLREIWELFNYKFGIEI